MEVNDDSTSEWDRSRASKRAFDSGEWETASRESEEEESLFFLHLQPQCFCFPMENKINNYNLKYPKKKKNFINYNFLLIIIIFLVWENRLSNISKRELPKKKKKKPKRTGECSSTPRSYPIIQSFSFHPMKSRHVVVRVVLSFWWLRGIIWFVGSW